ncbi:hypothetical protein [Rubritalea tangerina]|uniref:hypothetical protein n=1 Tax=Rubritalea tangerina TaxID=430798 RepID=UPI0036085F5A
MAFFYFLHFRSISMGNLHKSARQAPTFSQISSLHPHNPRSTYQAIRSWLWHRC